MRDCTYNTDNAAIVVSVRLIGVDGLNEGGGEEEANPTEESEAEGQRAP